MTVSSNTEKKSDLPKSDSPVGKVVVKRPRIAYAKMYSGPIPEGDELIKYEKAYKGAASRIITMAEKQSAHRQAIEARVITANIIDQRIGLIFALLVALSLVASGTYLILHDKQLTGMASLISGPGIPALIYLFVQRKAPQELRAKDEELQKSRQNRK